MNNNFIKVSRTILDWEWYKTKNTKMLFIHMLLRANWADEKFKGIDIPRGSFVSSYPNLCAECGLTLNELRTALKHLKMTGEVTVKSYPKYSVFTIKNYAKYQDVNSQSTGKAQAETQSRHRQVNSQGTGKLTVKSCPESGVFTGKNDEAYQDVNSQITAKSQSKHSQKYTQLTTIEEDKEDKELKKDTYVSKESSRFAPPTPENVNVYCQEMGYIGFDAERFVDFYTSKNWYVGKNKMKDWKASVRNWQRQGNQTKTKKNQFQEFPQRDIDYDALVLQQLQGEKKEGE